MSDATRDATRHRIVRWRQDPGATYSQLYCLSLSPPLKSFRRGDQNGRAR